MKLQMKCFGVARDMAEAERLYKNPSSIDELSETFHRLMASLDFLPNSPCLMNAGKELQQLAACFVLPIEDSLESIFEMLKQTALIHQSGGGTGFSFSPLSRKRHRPGPRMRNKTSPLGIHQP